ncbi:hypothetical protein RF11_07541 [Thelohanellus kitauei]|uniref:Uncharacterized protein n=1 Tax=Thelohanellus kitauei TaxID=669202 RepID=A0A0C2I9I8_THEKT|nr:hypothetical protein RF11_07541 [Thelohanellus kitauei]
MVYDTYIVSEDNAKYLDFFLNKYETRDVEGVVRTYPPTEEFHLQHAILDFAFERSQVLIECCLEKIANELEDNKENQDIDEPMNQLAQRREYCTAIQDRYRACFELPNFFDRNPRQTFDVMWVLDISIDEKSSSADFDLA